MTFLSKPFKKITQTAQEMIPDSVSKINADFNELFKSLNSILDLKALESFPYYQFLENRTLKQYSQLPFEQQSVLFERHLDELISFYQNMEKILSRIAVVFPTGLDSFKDPNRDIAQNILSINSAIKADLKSTIEQVIFNFIEHPEFHFKQNSPLLFSKLNSLKKQKIYHLSFSRLLPLTQDSDDLKTVISFFKECSPYEEKIKDYVLLNNLSQTLKQGCLPLQTWLLEDSHYSNLIDAFLPETHLSEQLFELLTFARNTAQIQLFSQKITSKQHQELKQYLQNHDLGFSLTQIFYISSIEDLNLFLDAFEVQGWPLFQSHQTLKDLEETIGQGFHFLTHFPFQGFSSTKPPISFLQTLCKRMDLNFQDEHGWSILHLKAQQENKSMVEFLLKIGVNPLLENHHKLRASDLLKTSLEIKQKASHLGLQKNYTQSEQELIDLLNHAELSLITPPTSKKSNKPKI